MITEQGTVVAVEDDALWVETIQQSTCQSCQARQGCGQRLMSKMGAKPLYLRVLLGDRKAESYRVSDTVTLGIPENVVVTSSLIAYLIPLLFMLVFSGFAHSLWQSDLASLLAGLSGLIVSAVFIYFYVQRYKNDQNYQAFLVDSELTPVKMVNFVSENN